MRRGWRFNVKHRKNGRSLVVPPPPFFKKNPGSAPDGASRSSTHEITRPYINCLYLPLWSYYSVFTSASARSRIPSNARETWHWTVIVLGSWSSYSLLEIQVMYTTCLSPNMYVWLHSFKDLKTDSICEDFERVDAHSKLMFNIYARQRIFIFHWPKSL